MADPHADLFVTNASGGDVIGIGFRKSATRVDSQALRDLAERLANHTFIPSGALCDAADELDRLRLEVAALRKKLRAASASLAEDDPQGSLDA
nr:hypothetical protein [uncultured Rhodopila sp.]